MTEPDSSHRKKNFQISRMAQAVARFPSKYGSVRGLLSREKMTMESWTQQIENLPVHKCLRRYDPCMARRERIWAQGAVVIALPRAESPTTARY